MWTRSISRSAKSNTLTQKEQQNFSNTQRQCPDRLLIFISSELSPVYAKYCSLTNTVQIDKFVRNLNKKPMAEKGFHCIKELQMPTKQNCKNLGMN
jgi:hypothetical protein